MSEAKDLCTCRLRDTITSASFPPGAKRRAASAGKTAFDIRVPERRYELAARTVHLKGGLAPPLLSLVTRATSMLHGSISEYKAGVATCLNQLPAESLVLPRNPASGCDRKCRRNKPTPSNVFAGRSIAIVKHCFVSPSGAYGWPSAVSGPATWSGPKKSLDRFPRRPVGLHKLAQVRLHDQSYYDSCKTVRSYPKN